jgi:hypothetical protein
MQELARGDVVIDPVSPDVFAQHGLQLAENAEWALFWKNTGRAQEPRAGSW